MTLAGVLVAAYLLGSIPTSYLVVRRLAGRDIREVGSRIPGTMNVLDSVGVGPALLVGLIDIGKGLAAVVLAYEAGLGDDGAVFAGLLAVTGHVWPVSLRFHGGNGTAPAVGALLGLLPVATLLATAVAAVVSRVAGRRVGGLVGLSSVTPIAYVLEEPSAAVLGAAILVGVVFLRIGRVEGFSLARPPR